MVMKQKLSQWSPGMIELNKIRCTRVWTHKESWGVTLSGATPPCFSRSSADCHPSVLTYSIRCSDCTKTDLERSVFPKWMSRIIARMREELHANWWVPHVRIYNVFFFFFFSEATAVVLYGVQRKLCALAALTHSGCNWVWQVDICWQRRETGV